MTRIAENLHLKSGRYYYVRRRAGRVVWTALSQEQGQAMQEYEKLRATADAIEAAAPPPPFSTQSQIAALYARTRERARQADIEFTLTIDDVRAMASKNNWRCALTNIRFSNDRTDNAHARA